MSMQLCVSPSTGNLEKRKLHKATIALGESARAALQSRVDSDGIERTSVTLSVSAQTIRSALKGIRLTRPVCGWLTILLGFPRPF